MKIPPTKPHKETLSIAFIFMTLRATSRIVVCGQRDSSELTPLSMISEFVSGLCPPEFGIDSSGDSVGYEGFSSLSDGVIVRSGMSGALDHGKLRPVTTPNVKPKANEMKITSRIIEAHHFASSPLLRFS
jgi:hypothetical protein